MSTHARKDVNFHFTQWGYLSMNREFFDELCLEKDSPILEIDNKFYDFNILKKTISFNEHRDIVRWRGEVARRALMTLVDTEKNYKFFTAKIQE